MGADYEKRASAMIGGKISGPQAANLTRFYFPFGGPPFVAEVAESMYIPFPCLIGHLYIRSDVPAGVGEDVFVMIRLNEANTNNTQAIAGAAPTAAGADPDVFAVPAGGRITMRVITSLNCAAINVNWSFEIRR